jgi:acyl dehydratase
MLKELDSAPAFPPLFAKAALASVCGGSGSGELPSTVYARPQVEVAADDLAAYNRVCGFPLADELPPTYPHMLGFPLQMKLMTDGDFPFPPIGTVHVANRITVHRPLRVTDRLQIRVYAQNLRPHPKGRQFDLITESYVDGELAWHEVSTYLRRGGGSGEQAESGSSPAGQAESGCQPEPSAVWQVAEDAGRRYAEVSGDANPIHLYSLTAKLFGFPRAIAHGMWTKARCLSLLEGRLPERYTVDVAFKKPVLLPSKVAFSTSASENRRDFELHNAKNGKPHIEGTIEKL